ncbi:hypothetical protein N7539_003844 [Penicillium diatomitis]|uniref:Uncharacterized protein n=1 Tax=Penicillium diatomitis TaxID=2819901 RepID=A0A9X0BXY7_9EURO|nr:uncharacterized protein N7539_003844 [Penicillium diatomitis]KAJ5488954.1 hypothetical protein N7539_003844 [Penicillium diatomitis]
MANKRKASTAQQGPAHSPFICNSWTITEESLPPPPADPFEDYSPRDMTGCPPWFGHAEEREDGENEGRLAKRVRIADDGCRYEGPVISSDNNAPVSAASTDHSIAQNDMAESEVRISQKNQISAALASQKSSRNSRHRTGDPKKRKRAKRAKSFDEGDRNYVDDDDSEDSDEDDMPGAIHRSERDDVVFILSRQKAKRMAKAVKIPKNAQMGDEEKALYLDLATRGCFPLFPPIWKRDFTTLPDSLFPSTESELDNNDFAFTVHARPRFHAIRAFHALLRAPGHVRDCRILTVRPQDVARKAIKKYLRWAIADAGLTETRETKSAYAVTTQRPGEKTLSVVQRATEKMEYLGREHQRMFANVENPYWPTLIGFCICGPIVVILSVDTDPSSPIWEPERDSHVKYMGQFDMSKDSQDVWNALAVAIAVIHIRRTMIRLATRYPDVVGVAHPPTGKEEIIDEDL